MYEERSSPSSLIEYAWMASIDVTGGYTHPANEYWGLTFLNDNGVYEARLQGPTTQPVQYSYRKGQEYWGVALKAHIFLKSVQKSNILNSTIHLQTQDNAFRLAGHCFLIRPYTALEMLIDEMQEKGILQENTHIAKALLPGNTATLSKRSLQRHFIAAVGLSEPTVKQITRARQAYSLLERGEPIRDVVHAMNYADQAHLTRSLKLLADQTPAKLLGKSKKQT